MSELIGYEPARVLHYFEEITKIPHGSGNTGKISNYLRDFGKSRGLKTVQDKAGNVTIFKKSRIETENTVIIQGHMDMVCEKSPECTKDMETEGLDIYVEDGEIKAKGTTLGGDDGIAVAMALALLEDEEQELPNLEAVFTVDEEIGMLGAAAYDAADLKGHTMINIDSEVEGVFTVSCAGGTVGRGSIPVDTESMDGTVLEIKISGLTGGHSGIEIHKNRANACILLGQLLDRLNNKPGIRIIEACGGAKDNAIAVESSAVIMLTNADYDTFFDEFKTIAAELKKNYANTDQGMTVESRIISLDPAYSEEDVYTDADMYSGMKIGSLHTNVMTKESSDRVIDLLTKIPNGVVRMSQDVEGLVQTSLNLGTLSTEVSMEDNGQGTPVRTPKSVHIANCLRSSVDSEKTDLKEDVEGIINELGGSVEFEGDYPGWKYRTDSTLRDLCRSVYNEQYGREPVIEAIHAGVECGYFAAKVDDLDCISIGPDIKEIHTYRESLSIESVARTYNFVCEVLRRLAK